MTLGEGVCIRGELCMIECQCLSWHEFNFVLKCHLTVHSCIIIIKHTCFFFKKTVEMYIHVSTHIYIL